MKTEAREYQPIINPEENSLLRLPLDEALKLAKAGKPSQALPPPKVSIQKDSVDENFENSINFKNAPLNILWYMEGDDIGDCLACQKEFNLYKAFRTNHRCPFCGQKYDIINWVS